MQDEGQSTQQQYLLRAWQTVEYLTAAAQDMAARGPKEEPRPQPQQELDAFLSVPTDTASKVQLEMFFMGFTEASSQCETVLEQPLAKLESIVDVYLNTR